MNKYIVSSLFLAPMVCMNVYADNMTVAQDALKGAVVELTTVAQNSKDKDLAPLIGEVHAVLDKATPGILSALAALTDEERMNLIMGLGQMPELANLQAATQPLSESKAAATVMPLFAGSDASVAITSISTATKLQLIDIIANVTKIAVAMGVDVMAAPMINAYTADDPDACGTAQ